MLKAVQWPLRSFGNFAITSVGVIGIGFWSYSVYSEGKFNQPIIGESIKLLGKHPQIKELAGISSFMQAIHFHIVFLLATASWRSKVKVTFPFLFADPRAKPT